MTYAAARAKAQRKANLRGHAYYIIHVQLPPDTGPVDLCYGTLSVRALSTIPTDYRILEVISPRMGSRPILAEDHPTPTATFHPAHIQVEEVRRFPAQEVRLADDTLTAPSIVPPQVGEEASKDLMKSGESIIHLELKRTGRPNQPFGLSLEARIHPRF